MHLNRLTTLSNVRKALAITVFSTMLWACNGTPSTQEGRIAEAANAFVANYYGWRFHKAQEYATDASAKWLSFVASQVQEDDLERVREAPAPTFELGDITLQGDTAATVDVTLHDILVMDSLGQSARQLDHITTVLHLVMSPDKHRWLVNLEGLPQEK